MAFCGYWTRNGSCSTPLLNNDDSYFGYDVVTAWGEFETAQLNLWDLKTSVEVKKGEAVMFFGRGLVHNAIRVTGGIRNVVDLFCHQNVFGWHQEQQGHHISYKPQPDKPSEVGEVGREKWVAKDKKNRKRKTTGEN